MSILNKEFSSSNKKDASDFAVSVFPTPVCPKNRKNFLSYSYVLHKFCELLELDDLLVYFPLLKSREKLQQQDRIWEKICRSLQWQYIPSI